MIKFKNLFQFSRKEIKDCFDNAKFKAKIDGLKIIQSKQDNLESGKILIITPRKSGKASKRNLIRRRIKSIYYEEKLYKKNIVSIIFVYKQAIDLSFDQLKTFLIKNI